MTNKSYEELSILEKKEMIGKLQHLIQTDEDTFLMIDKLIKTAEELGYFKGVKILSNIEE